MTSVSKQTNKAEQEESLPLDILVKNLSVNLTKLELSNKKILSSDLENIKLPLNMEILIISQNNLKELPDSVTNLGKLKKLDVSCNNIVYFDEAPKFCHTVEYIDLSNNNLKGPPYWVWTESPQNLQYLNLSLNEDITSCLTDCYYEELIQNTCPITQLDIYNCKLQNHLELIGSFSQLKSLKVGSNELSLSTVNFIENFPNKGLEKCCDLEAIDLRNTKIYTIDTNINIYKNLKELNLSFNNISSIPSQLCDLESLELFAISFNELLYLPECIVKLINLKKLYLDHNQLCVLPENLNELEKLETLDLYCNFLYEVPDIQHVLEIDIAQNYCEEPDDCKYKIKKEKLRGNLELAEKRLDGCATEDVRTLEEDHWEDSSVEEWNEQQEESKERISTSVEQEDWDSDDYWVPHPPRPHIPLETPWQRFLKQKLREGNFCPSDMHAMSVADRVKYEKMGKPKFSAEVIGQFDDLSDEGS